MIIGYPWSNCHFPTVFLTFPSNKFSFTNRTRMTVVDAFLGGYHALIWLPEKHSLFGHYNGEIARFRVFVYRACFLNESPWKRSITDHSHKCQFPVPLSPFWIILPKRHLWISAVTAKNYVVPSMNENLRLQVWRSCDSKLKADRWRKLSKIEVNDFKCFHTNFSYYIAFETNIKNLLIFVQ